jgi:hypothetical protein
MDVSNTQFTAGDFNLTKAAYSVNDFAGITGLGRNMIYKSAKLGELVITKVGKRSLISTPDAVTFLNRHRSSSLRCKEEAA